MRTWLFLLMIGGGAGGQGDALERVPLAKGSPGYKIRLCYALPEGTKAVEKPEGRKARLEKDDYFFFDVDGNGKWNDLGVDGWARHKMPLLLPLEEKTVFGASEFTWTVEADGSAVSFRRDPLRLSEGQRQVLVQFNQWRVMNGLPAVTIDQQLSDACNRHCAYMEKYSELTHEQDPAKEGYTADGAEAGKRSCIGEEGPVESVHLFYATFYHRLPLISPDTKQIGVGASQRYAAVDGLTRRDRRAWTYPVIVPGPNTFFHPTHFAHEAPDPLPEGAPPAGFPITLTFATGKITDAKVELRVKNEKGPVLPVYLSSPEFPANPKRPDNRMSICAIPRAPLKPVTTHWVKATYMLDGEAREHTWFFNTGRLGPAAVLRYLPR
jgi:Cysteine-rich secretory protein family